MKTKSIERIFIKSKHKVWIISNLHIIIQHMIWVWKTKTFTWWKTRIYDNDDDDDGGGG